MFAGGTQMCATRGNADAIVIRRRVTARSFPMHCYLTLAWYYFALNVKFAVTGFPAATVIFCAWGPNSSCQAVRVYVPGGILSILNEPFSFVAACGPLTTTM